MTTGTTTWPASGKILSRNHHRFQPAGAKRGIQGCGGVCHADLDAEPRQNGHALPVLNAAPEPAVDPEDPIYQVQSLAMCQDYCAAVLEG